MKDVRMLDAKYICECSERHEKNMSEPHQDLSGREGGREGRREGGKGEGGREGEGDRDHDIECESECERYIDRPALSSMPDTVVFKLQSRPRFIVNIISNNNKLQCDAPMATRDATSMPGGGETEASSLDRWRSFYRWDGFTTTC